MTVKLQSLRLPCLLCVFTASIIALGLSYNSPSWLRDVAETDSLGSWPRQIASTHANAYQLDPPSDGPPWGAIVSAKRSSDDVSWLAGFEQNWTSFHYDLDNPQTEDVRLQLPVAKGHEAIVSLTWIIQNYNSLPWHAIFVHGNPDVWDQDDGMTRLTTGLDRNALARAGYVSLRCDWNPSCPAGIRLVAKDAVVWGPSDVQEDIEVTIAATWKNTFLNAVLPQTIASQIGARFAVTRQAILRRPISDYERLQRWLVHTPLESNTVKAVFERLWAYIFTGEAVQ